MHVILKTRPSTSPFFERYEEMDENERAYKIQKLLRQNELSSMQDRELDNASSLARVKHDIDQFLRSAQTTPATCVEVPVDHRSADGEEGTFIEMNIVAGVLEEKENLKRGEDNLLLPTEETKEELHRRRVEEAEAFMRLMTALDPQAAGGANKKLVEECASSGSSVVVMDADDLCDEDSSEDERKKPRRRIEEM
ncbi:hypothetical protein AGDE_07244 [Angomonas deanei]|uniref:Uncharacterized protein n=1 Tax=Angomonas deanei TaxID=59799 RepID=A0A7G2CA66_9TRYP|nr:hypothetical protein AGDE_07244 [Angomonas deanei]CAD2216668.1 hypothetical protein, conserved [Angomonas deanei]|eukprot:EPY35776.1 hypothetical protein AGDE_07244 [Angomonas deanei]